jgi:lycopene beta-cyclase
VPEHPEFDHVIVGAGLSGLLLARRLLMAADAGRLPGAVRIALVGPVPDPAQRVTFAHWARRPTPLDDWSIGAWSELQVVDHAGHARVVGLDGYRYTALAWDRARAALRQTLAADPRVTVVAERAVGVGGDADAAWADLPGARVLGRWAFDSRPPFVDPVPGAQPAALHQAFRGVWVRTGAPTVDPAAATLLDFSADDGPDLGFAYVLPVDERRAMVMAVRMGPSMDLPDPLPAVARVVGSSRWTIEAEERGVTPLPGRPAPRRTGQRMLRIGARGGRVRASTGYAVTRVLADTGAIVASLSRHGHPFGIPPDPRRDRALDAIWLAALARERADLEPAFLALFRDVPVDRVLRFLDGGASPVDVAAVVAALPPGPFLGALGALARQRLIR